MSRRTVEPVSPVDAFNPPADSPVILHDDATAEAYRQVTADARRRQRSGLPPEGSAVRQSPAAPSRLPLPSVQVARQIAGAEIQRLSLQCEALTRQSEARPVMGGTLGPYGADINRAMDTQREAARVQLAQVRAELEKLEAIYGNDQAVMEWAQDHEATHPGRVR